MIRGTGFGFQFPVGGRLYSLRVWWMSDRKTKFHSVQCVHVQLQSGPKSDIYGA